MPHTKCHHKRYKSEWNVLKLSTMDFSHLRLLAIFATVVESGSFAAAARKLQSSRSRISEQVSALEESLDVRLLQRSTRQLTITTEGQRVYTHAKKLPDILQQVEAITTPEKPSGRVILTLTHDIAHKYLLPILADFQQSYPDVQLELILDDSALNLIGEKIDLAIRIGIPKDDSLIARVMHEECFSLFASPSYLAKAGNIENNEQLQAMQWVTLTHSLQSDQLHCRQNNELIELNVSHAYRCNSPLMQQQMVIQGLGIGMLLPSTV